MKTATKPVREELSIQGIRADVERCLSIEDENDPCTHCRQKLFLLERIDGQAKDADNLDALSRGANGA